MPLALAQDLQSQELSFGKYIWQLFADGRSCHMAGPTAISTWPAHGVNFANRFNRLSGCHPKRPPLKHKSYLVGTDAAARGKNAVKALFARVTVLTMPVFMQSATGLKHIELELIQLEFGFPWF